MVKFEFEFTSNFNSLANSSGENDNASYGKPWKVLSGAVGFCKIRIGVSTAYICCKVGFSPHSDFKFRLYFMS